MISWQREFHVFLHACIMANMQLETLTSGFLDRYKDIGYNIQVPE